MTRQARRSAVTLLFVSSLTFGCSGSNTAQDKACDPGDRRTKALQAEPALNTAPAGFHRVKAGIHGSTYDEIETHICNDVLLYFSLEPAPDGMAALRALERQLKADGWTGVLVDTQVQAIAATKSVAGATASLRGNVIAAKHTLRVSVALPPAVREPMP
jgi:hypothetical protein